MEEIVDIVNEKDKVVGTATRKEAHAKNLLHRLVHVMVENSTGKILCLTRTKNTDVYPLWQSNVGGHVSSGEKYEIAAKRELKEEIGIEGEPDFFGVVMVMDGKYSHQVGCFKIKNDGPFTPDKSEIEKMEFKSVEQVMNEISAGAKYTPTFVKVIEKIYH